jgi:MFS family permease
MDSIPFGTILVGVNGDPASLHSGQIRRSPLGERGSPQATRESHIAHQRIILPAILIFACALASLSRLGPHIGQFYLTFFVLGLVANGTAQFAYTRTVLTWFHKHRGFALALILTGSGVGSVLIPPITQ